MISPSVPSSSGSSAPGRRKVWVPVAIFSTIGLLVLGLVVDFIPAIGFRDRRAMVVFGAIGLWLAVLLYRDMLRRERTSAGQAGWKTWLMFPCLAAMLGLVVWIILIIAVPWMITRVLGSDHQLRATMQTEERLYSRQLCDHRLTGGPVRDAFPQLICIDPDFYKRYPDQTVAVDLKGKVTSLGFAIISVHHVNRTASDHAD